MRVVTTSGTREIKIIPRYLQEATETYTVVLTNEETKEEESITVSNYTVTDYNTNISQVLVPITSTYSEGSVFRIKVTDSSDRITYRGKLFVTDQTPQNYSING